MERYRGLGNSNTWRGQADEVRGREDEEEQLTLNSWLASCREGRRLRNSDWSQICAFLVVDVLHGDCTHVRLERCKLS